MARLGWVEPGDCLLELFMRSGAGVPAGHPAPAFTEGTSQ